MPHDPVRLRALVRETATLLLAVGLDEATLFVQSRVPAHAQLAYLLECMAYTGELNRMIQFKEKGRGVDSTRVSLFTYPALMAADILLYRPTAGAGRRRPAPARRADPRPGDPLQQRATARCSPSPRSRRPPPARGSWTCRPDSPRWASPPDGGGSVYLLDPPDVVRRKVARAVTDSESGADAVRPAPDKPGVTNLLDILAACGGSADGVTTYGALKRAVTDAVVAELEPIQKRYAELAADPAHVDSVYAAGAARCREVTAPVLAAAETAIGLS